ncbi:permease [Poseidonocella sedimentorum]|uniref:Permease n=1 Tax=Poseidonocella sedimentorum TaxID=871652 RepID=A0A1I6CNC4_9RHOB|nr:permease [Poseidonocella sedimentorum]SFQ94670.1 hypothetical protein SAMN04515673_10173 [Poseidonocella sedimentorum]
MSDATIPAPRFGALRAALLSPWALILIALALVALLDAGRLGEVTGAALEALWGTLPYIVGAVLLLAYLRASGAEVMVAAAFKGRETRMIVFAALLGGLAPFCSCEVIPFIAGLLALGAPLSAVMAFWLSSPLIDPPTLLITAAALGWPFALAKAAAAVLLGLGGGFAMRGLVRSGAFPDALRASVPKASCCGASSCGPEDPATARAQWRFWTEPARRETFRHEAITNGLFLLKWLAFAYVLQALLITYVPSDTIGGLVGGDGIVPVIMAALVGMPAYLNSYVAPPLVAGFVEQGMSAGAAMAFMIAGAVSCIPAMTAIWSLVRPPVFAAYLGLGLAGAILLGLIAGALPIV